MNEIKAILIGILMISVTIAFLCGSTGILSMPVDYPATAIFVIHDGERMSRQVTMTFSETGMVSARSGLWVDDGTWTEVQKDYNSRTYRIRTDEGGYVTLHRSGRAVWETDEYKPVIGHWY